MPAPRARREPKRIGAIQPSQLLYTYGVGAMVELPHFSVLVGGLDGWDARHQATIAEPRLMEALRPVVGTQLQSLRQPPWEPETNSNWDDWAWVGVPAYPFPRWLRCTRCNLLEQIDKRVFTLDVNPVRTDRSRYFHDGCGGAGRKPDAQPVRVVAACPAGHLDDFPWTEMVHKDKPCTGIPILELKDSATASRATHQMASCRTCDEQFFVQTAFTQRAATFLPRCRGRHPQLRRFDQRACTNQITPSLVGASNEWFAASMSALSLPVGGTPVDEAVHSLWHLLQAATERPVLDALLMTADCAPLRAWLADEVWDAVERHRNHPGAGDPSDVQQPEWQVLTSATPPTTDEFHAVHVGPPAAYQAGLADVLLVDRLREVVALYGFTRIASLDDEDETGTAIARRAPISIGPPVWLPATETRGEGVFITLPESRVAAWESLYSRQGCYGRLIAAHRQWRANRNLDPHVAAPPVRYVLLHTFAHLVLNEIAVECGYNAASITERIYARPASHPSGPMAGVLLYTAASDSEGTLGGLVSLGHPPELARLLEQALTRAKLCSGDPHCSDHRPGEHTDDLHAAACHACLFLPETSCERGNRFLDRASVVPTLCETGVAYQWTT
jgi:hypothetical protein